jgi:hypothetical protein
LFVSPTCPEKDTLAQVESRAMAMEHQQQDDAKNVGPGSDVAGEQRMAASTGMMTRLVIRNPNTYTSLGGLVHMVTHRV